MKINTNDAFSYTGNVMISYKKKGSNLIFRNHKAGNIDLFKTLSRFLCGYNVNKAIPDSIGLFVYLKNDKSNRLNCLYPDKRLPISRRVIGSETENCPAIFTALLSMSDINWVPANKDSISRYELVLYSADGQYELASVDVDKSVINEVTSGNGVEALIQWELLFENYGDNKYADIAQ